jgi:hypothetical protein
MKASRLVVVRASTSKIIDRSTSRGALPNSSLRRLASSLPWLASFTAMKRKKRAAPGVRWASICLTNSR